MSTSCYFIILLCTVGLIIAEITVGELYSQAVSIPPSLLPPPPPPPPSPEIHNKTWSIPVGCALANFFPSVLIMFINSLHALGWTKKLLVISHIDMNFSPEGSHLPLKKTNRSYKGPFPRGYVENSKPAYWRNWIYHMLSYVFCLQMLLHWPCGSPGCLWHDFPQQLYRLHGCVIGPIEFPADNIQYV